MSDVTTIKLATMDALKGNDIKFTDDTDARGASLVVPFELHSLHFDFHVLFYDGGSVTVGGMLPLKIPDGKLLDALDAINAANDRFRFYRFYARPDSGRVVMIADVDIDPATVGDMIVKLIARGCQIADHAYPDLIKAVF